MGGNIWLDWVSIWVYISEWPHLHYPLKRGITTFNHIPIKRAILPTKERQFPIPNFLLYKQRLNIVILQI